MLGCEFGFLVGDATLIDCAADCIYGPAYMNAYDDRRNKVAGDLTILPPSDDYHNGSGVAAFIGNENSNLNIHNGGGALGEGLVIRVGGNTGNVAQLENPDHTASGNTIYNYSGYPVVINEGSNDNEIHSCPPVTDNGSGNTITYLADCDIVEACGGVMHSRPSKLKHYLSLKEQVWEKSISEACFMVIGHYMRT